MRYFEEHYSDLSYPLKQADALTGLRAAQLGAIHSIAAHFSGRREPAIITMPTGSGKTAVLTAAALVLRAKRVLVIAPNRLVREQLVEQFAHLTTLRALGAVPGTMAPPKVANIKKRISSEDDWERLRAFDVIIGMPQSISTAFDSVPPPPTDLFDVVLVDEAHHSPAKTWQVLLDEFPEAQRVLFTATPYRQDQREIKGRFVYTYDLKRAFDDGVFGRITFEPVIPAAVGETNDVAIARATEAKFREDHRAGLRHHVLVRTDSRKRAELLEEMYRTHTALRLKLVTGDKSLRYLKGVLEELTRGDLDGIVCVNMMGEGVDFPSLKIAAIHSPHRSLNVTLQFIGRFARTTGERLGQATFLAIPSEIEIETERLYDTRAVWQVMVENLSASRVSHETTTREVLESFNHAEVLSADLADLSLYVLEPYYHVKIYQMTDLVDVRSVVFPDSMELIYQNVSAEHNAAIFITREFSQPRWTTDDRLVSVQADLFVVHQDTKSKLLFMCASQRSDGLYDELARSFAGANPRPLPLARLNRALNDLTSPEFFNVGMRNRVSSSTTESYRMITGSNADKAVLPSDGRLYHRGHVFGRATDAGQQVTIGLSSASKIWSNRSSKIPQLIEWCATLADRINSDRVPITGSGLDYLEVGEVIDALPDAIVAVNWPQHIVRQYPGFEAIVGGRTYQAKLLDLDIAVDREQSSLDTVVIAFSYGEEFTYRATFSFRTDRYFEPAPGPQPDLHVEHDRGYVPMVDFLNTNPLWLYTAGLGLVEASSYIGPPADDRPFLDLNQIEVAPWVEERVNIRREFGDAGEGLRSVHEWLEGRLAVSESAVVYYDHGTGEVADFVAVTGREGGGLLIQLYHCKGAGGASPGHRLDDMYEVAMQAVKSVTWGLKQRILSTIKRRFTQRVGSHRFVKGDLELLERLLNGATPAQIEFECIAVQPGLAKDGLPASLEQVLAASSDHLVRAAFRPLRVIASAE